MGRIGQLLADRGVVAVTAYNGARTVRAVGTLNPALRLADHDIWDRYNLPRSIEDPQPGIGHTQRTNLLHDVATAALHDGFFDAYGIPRDLALDAEDVSDIAYLFGGEGLLSPLWRQYGQPLALGPDPLPSRREPTGIEKHLAKGYLERFTPLAWTADDMATHGYKGDNAIDLYEQDIAQQLRAKIKAGTIDPAATPAAGSAYTFVTVTVDWFLRAEAVLSREAAATTK